MSYLDPWHASNLLIAERWLRWLTRVLITNLVVIVIVAYAGWIKSAVALLLIEAPILAVWFGLGLYWFELSGEVERD